MEHSKSSVHTAPAASSSNSSSMAYVLHNPEEINLSAEAGGFAYVNRNVLDERDRTIERLVARVSEMETESHKLKEEISKLTQELELLRILNKVQDSKSVVNTAAPISPEDMFISEIPLFTNRIPTNPTSSTVVFNPCYRPEDTKKCAEVGLAFLNQNEGEDLELVDPIYHVDVYVVGGVSYHVNFTAKPKDLKNHGGDPSPKLYFAEVCTFPHKIRATICCAVDEEDGTYDCEFCCRGGVPKGKALLHPSSDVYKRKKQGTGPYPTVEECVASGVKFYPVGQNKGCTIDYGSLRLY